MNLEEMQARCKLAQVTKQSDVDAVGPLYWLLDLHKDDFCKLVDAVGLDKLVKVRERWERLARAYEAMATRETYERNKARLEAIADEAAGLREHIEQYEQANKL